MELSTPRKLCWATQFEGKSPYLPRISCRQNTEWLLTNNSHSMVNVTYVRTIRHCYCQLVHTMSAHQAGTEHNRKQHILVQVEQIYSVYTEMTKKIHTLHNQENIWQMKYIPVSPVYDHHHLSSQWVSQTVVRVTETCCWSPQSTSDRSIVYTQ